MNDAKVAIPAWLRAAGPICGGFFSAEAAMMCKRKVNSTQPSEYLGS